MNGAAMFQIRHVRESDKPFWFALDKHISENELQLKIRDKRGYIISDDDKPVGILRYNLFWDNSPFLTLIYLDESYRGKGFGKQAMLAERITERKDTDTELWEKRVAAIKSHIS